MNGQRTLAPLGRRLAEVTTRQEVGAYALVSAYDRDGPPAPRPGQFYMLAAERGWGGGEGERPYLPRAFSFARARPDPRGGIVLQFLVEAVGPGTGILAELDAGDGLWLTGPLGVGFDPGPERPLLVGGGIGVAPLLGLGDALPSARIMLGFRSGEHALAARLFDDDVLVATDDGSTGRQCLVTDLLVDELDVDVTARVFACGPGPMLESVRAICADRGVPCQLALESGMACGFGACFGCVVATRSGYVRLCLDGPVLEGDELESALVPGAGH